MSAKKMRGYSRRPFLIRSVVRSLFPSSRRPFVSAAGLAGKLVMIKGPHSADEAKFEAEIIADFKKGNPGVDVEFTTYDGDQRPELTAGFASGSPPAACSISCIPSIPPTPSAAFCRT